MTFTVAIVGRPNVGKSTLFNRLAGRRLAIVNDAPGVTRDRRQAEASIADLNFTIIDTAGLQEATVDTLAGRMRQQTERALADSDVALLLIDARAGLTPVDKYFANWLRQKDTPVILCANKCEAGGGQAGLLEAYSLGLGDPLPISAEHGDGLGDLYDALRPYSDQAEQEEAEQEDDDDDIDKDERPLQLAIVGRPNVGKSTMVNRLLGEERMLTGPDPGVTRDAISVEWNVDGRRIRLVDTAGLRRKARVTEKIESLSVDDSFRAIRFAQVVALVLEAETGLEKQDLTIARKVIEEGRAPLILLNKWDLVGDRAMALRRVEDRLQTSLPQVKGIPVIPCSALKGRGVEKILPAALGAFDLWNRRIATSTLNDWLGRMTQAHTPPLARGRRVKLRYMTQAKTRPPTFVIFASRPDALPDAYMRYLVNGLREDFGLPGIPLRLLMRKGDNPYA